MNENLHPSDYCYPISSKCFDPNLEKNEKDFKNGVRKRKALEKKTAASSTECEKKGVGGRGGVCERLKSFSNRSTD